LAYDGYYFLKVVLTLLLFKLITVPFFILIISLAGKRWGSEVAGTLGGFPVVAGPIVFFLILEQGVDFGLQASISAMYGTIGILVFGLAYGWACQYWHYIPCLITALLAWFIAAYLLALLPTQLLYAVVITLFFLILLPRLLPKIAEQVHPPQNLKDLPLRIVVGALLTYLVTTQANDLGGVWSGLLSVFPSVSLVLAVFIHRSLGRIHVVQIFRGISKGLYSFIAYFIIHALLISYLQLWQTILLSCVGSIAIQFCVQHAFQLQTKNAQV
jgi:uncharacterized membrane protein (GlpM family)